jgi:glycosyltransferase involved in cell wall biosynthesis
MSLIEWLAYRCADACIGLAPGIVEGIRRRSPKNRQIEMIPNGCDLDLFNPARRAPLVLPGVGPSDFVAGFTGAHGVANGLDAVLDAAAELKWRGRSDIKLVLIGDGKCKEGLVARARHEGLDNCLFFAPVRKTEVARLTASLGCGLQILADVPAFYYGTSPNKFFDYISAGLPVVTNYPGWLADIITECDCGIAVAPRDAVALADALCRLQGEAELRATMGGNARTLAESRFARDRLSDQAVEFLEGVLGTR